MGEDASLAVSLVDFGPGCAGKGRCGWIEGLKTVPCIWKKQQRREFDSGGEDTLLALGAHLNVFIGAEAAAAARLRNCRRRRGLLRAWRSRPLLLFRETKRKTQILESSKTKKPKKNHTEKSSFVHLSRHMLVNLLKGAVVAELAAAAGGYYLFHRLNTDAEFRGWVGDTW